MRNTILLVGAAIAGAIVLTYATGGANAMPRSMAEATTNAQAVEAVGWRRRYWRRYGEWPVGPREEFENGPFVTANDDLIFVPVRPRSCGQYHYWDGFACVDARYNDPYLGPK